MKKLHFFTKYDSLGASSRVRSLQYLQVLSEEFDVTYSPLISNWALSLRYRSSSIYKFAYLFCLIRRIVTCVGRRIFDDDRIVVIEKELFPWLPFCFENLFLPSAFIIDADDAIFHYYENSVFLSDKFSRLAAKASAIHVGNEYLGSFYKQYNENVKIVRTSVDTGRYAKRSHLNSPPVVVWIGSPSTSKYIAEVADAFNYLSGRLEFKVLLIGFSDSNLESYFSFEYEIVEWSESVERQVLAHGDIGIMPIPDSPFERGKCGYKLIQYMASGLLLVASDVGINRFIIDGSAAGVVVEDGDWVSAIESAITLLPEYDASIGYQFAYENFDVHVTGEVLSASLKEINL